MSILKVAFPAGIGDTLWLMTKMQSLLLQEGKDQLHITICQDNLKRSVDFLKAFNFVSGVDYCDHSILKQPITHTTGTYNYHDSQRGWNGFDWFLQCNRHLEDGYRLEDWHPEWIIDWNIFNQFAWKQEHLQYAQDLKKRIGRYCVFYFGPESGNMECGHNRGPLWKPEHWKTLGRLCNRNCIQVVGVGANWDHSYYERYLEPIGFQCENYIGQWPIGQTLAVIRESEFVIGYQSGIVISAPFLGIRAGGFWRPYCNSISPTHFISFNERMSHCWVPPEVFKRGDWMPLIYGRDTPESIFKHIQENWL